MGCDFSFCHVADLHLGSRFWGISQKDPVLGNRLFESTFGSFSRIVDIAKERTDFMVIAGDVYEDTVMTPRTKMRFCDEARRYGKLIFIVKGNHDFRDSWKDSIPYPDNVYVMKDSPQSIKIQVRGRTVEIVGQSYPANHTADNLAVGLRGTPGVFTIGLLHCSVKEVAESSDYAPCALSDLLGRDVDYWALGHIHKRQVLRETGPAVVYPGNIQGRNPKETGEKGCYIVSVTGGSADLEFVPAQSMVWKTVDADITGMSSLPELVEKLRSETAPGSILGIRFAGRGPLDRAVRADPEGIAGQVSSAAGCIATVESVKTRPDLDLETAAEGGTLVSEIVRSADRMYGMSDEDILGLLTSDGPAKDLRPYLEYFASSGRLRELVKEAELSVIDRVAGGYE